MPTDVDPPGRAGPPPAHHRPGGGFRNPWPGGDVRGFGALARWQFLERPFKSIAPTPARGTLPRATPSLVLPRAAPGYRSATWIGQATVLLQLGPLNVLTDPIWSERASPFSWLGPRRLMPPGVDFDALPPIDLVLLSHNHYDHLDAPTVRRLAERFPAAQWLCPLGLSPLLRSLGAGKITERDWWESTDPVPKLESGRTEDDVVAMCVPARHFSARGPYDRWKTLWGGWILVADGMTIYFAGDTALHPEFDRIGAVLGPPDLVMLPIGAYEPRWFMEAVHMNPEDAVEAYRALTAGSERRPPCLALHWGTFRLTDEPVEEPPARFARRWREAGFPAESNWTLALGETRRL